MVSTDGFQVIGHGPILDFFKRVIVQNSLTHAYLFVGPKGIGKRQIALFLAGQLLPHFSVDQMHPDLFFVTRGMDEKTQKSHRDISVEDIRELRTRLERRALYGSWKIAIIDEAETLSINAANALLKTLEEPSPKTLIVLLASNVEALPATVISRTSVVNFFPVPIQEIEQVLIQKGCARQDAAPYARWSMGIPGTAIAFWQEEKMRKSYLDEIDRFLKFPHMSVAERFSILEDLMEKKVDHIKERRRWLDILEIWQLVIRDALRSRASLSVAHEEYRKSLHDFSAGKPASWFVRFFEAMEETKKQLLANVHPRLAVEYLLFTYF